MGTYSFFEDPNSSSTEVEEDKKWQRSRQGRATIAL